MDDEFIEIIIINICLLTTTYTVGVGITHVCAYRKFYYTTLCVRPSNTHAVDTKLINIFINILWSLM